MGGTTKQIRVFRQQVPRPPLALQMATPSWMMELQDSYASTPFDLVDAFRRPLNDLDEKFERESNSRIRLPSSGMKRSAGVLLILLGETSSPRLLLTRRALNLKSHAGEMSLPGGKIDGLETPLEAAIRECHEEIGVESSHLSVVGKITELQTMSSGISMSAFLARGLWDAYSYLKSDVEVDFIAEIPISELLGPNVYHQELWKNGAAQTTMHFFALGDDLVWGATAYIIVQWLKRIYSGYFFHDDRAIKGAIQWQQ